jgi:hypothetical protein
MRVPVLINPGIPRVSAKVKEGTMEFIVKKVIAVIDFSCTYM